MTNTQRLGEVRAQLLQWLAELPGSPRGCLADTDGIEENDPASLGECTQIQSESLLIVNGFYRGRRFDAGFVNAVWFMEEDELKIHSVDGQLLCVITADERTFENADTAAILQHAAMLEHETDDQQATLPQSDDDATRDIIRLPVADLSNDDDEIRRAA